MSTIAFDGVTLTIVLDKPLTTMFPLAVKELSLLINPETDSLFRQEDDGEWTLKADLYYAVSASWPMEATLWYMHCIDHHGDPLMPDTSNEENGWFKLITVPDHINNY